MDSVKKPIKGPSCLRPLRDVKTDFLNAYYAYTNKHSISDIQMATALGVHPNTLRDTLDEYSTSLNANLVIAFCLTFRTLDLEALYTGNMEEPQALEEEAIKLEKENERKYTIFRHSADCHELTDRAFMGTFYGYCRNTQNHSLIDSFVLQIGYNTHNKLQAKLDLNSCNQIAQTTQKVLYGKPMHLEPNIIYIVFQSDSGDDMFILTYNWFKIGIGKHLYCRYGSLTTPCRATDRFPQQQSFLMLDQPIAGEHLHFVDGFLHLSQDKIIVPADQYDAQAGGLMATNETVQSFFHQCKDLQYSAEPYYCFSEKVLLAMGEAHEIDPATVAATIMLLKEHSINPKAIDFPNNKTYSKFFAGLTIEEAEPLHS